MKWLARILRAVNAWAAAVGLLLLVGTLVATITITTFHTQWVVFLGGVLMAAAFAWLSHTANARWMIARRTAQLTLTRSRLASESSLRIHAEKALARVQTDVGLINEAMPAMLAYLGDEERVQYHNRAFARWTGLARTSIDGIRLEDVIGKAAYLQLKDHLAESKAGHDVRYDGNLTRPNGEACPMNVQFLTHYHDSGKVAGVFAIVGEIARTKPAAKHAPPPIVVPVAEGDTGARIVAALERDEFSLHWQLIAPLARAEVNGNFFHEVLLRMDEEEKMQIPPGMFLPVAEALGLLEEIDRWVVRHVIAFAALHRTKAETTYFVNLSPPTVLELEFAAFVRDLLEASGLPGSILCFELPEGEVLADVQAHRDFIDAFQGSGCRFAISGFGGTEASLDLVRRLPLQFLKLDGGIVLNMLRGADGHEKVKAIQKVARQAGIRTIAECVESDVIRAALVRLGIDFAQGFGIAKPTPMKIVDETRPREAAADVAVHPAAA